MSCSYELPNTTLAAYKEGSTAGASSYAYLPTYNCSHVSLSVAKNYWSYVYIHGYDGNTYTSLASRATDGASTLTVDLDVSAYDYIRVKYTVTYGEGGSCTIKNIKVY